MKPKNNLVKNQWTDVVNSDITGALDGMSLYEIKALIDSWIEECGADCIIDFHWTGYEDLDIRLLNYCEESNESFNARVKVWEAEQLIKEEQSRKDKQAHLDKIEKEKLKKEAVERELYEKLKEKYGV